MRIGGECCLGQGDIRVVTVWKGLGRLYVLMQGFFPGGGLGGSPHPAKILPIPPIRHLSPFLDQGLSPPAEVRPRKFEKFKYIFVSNLTTFKLKSTLKSCISCLK